MKRTVIFSLLFALLTLTGSGILLHGQEDELTEVEIKSGYLYNICIFTRWPHDNNSTDPIIISILGKTNPGNELYVPEERRIRLRKIIVRKIDSLAGSEGSHVLFITGSESNRLESILKYIEGKDILSMADTKGYAQRGVCINFFKEKGTVQFEINRGAVKKTNLEIHAQMYVKGKLVESN